MCKSKSSRPQRVTTNTGLVVEARVIHPWANPETCIAQREDLISADQSRSASRPRFHKRGAFSQEWTAARWKALSRWHPGRSHKAALFAPERAACEATE